jgi:hypothetical protein
MTAVSGSAVVMMQQTDETMLEKQATCLYVRLQTRAGPLACRHLLAAQCSRPRVVSEFPPSRGQTHSHIPVRRGTLGGSSLSARSRLLPVQQKVPEKATHCFVYRLQEGSRWGCCPPSSQPNPMAYSRLGVQGGSVLRGRKKHGPSRLHPRAMVGMGEDSEAAVGIQSAYQPEGWPSVFVGSCGKYPSSWPWRQ